MTSERDTAARSPLAPWPDLVFLEVTNRCNMRCRLCHFHGDGVEPGRPLGTMEERLWRPAIEELGDWGTPMVFQPWGMGEPLLHPEFWTIVAHAVAQPNLEVAFFTNGMAWKEEDFAAAIDVGVHRVTFSLDGVRPDVLEYYRNGANFAQVEAAVRRLHAAREEGHHDRPAICLNMVCYDEIVDDVPAYIERWRDIAEEICISRCRPIDGPTHPELPFDRSPCHHLDKILVVGWDGAVGMCCEDSHGENIFGHYPARSLTEIWQGEEIERARRLHREGRWDEIPECSTCELWSQLHNRVRHDQDFDIVEDPFQTVYLRPRDTPAV